MIFKKQTLRIEDLRANNSLNQGQGNLEIDFFDLFFKSSNDNLILIDNSGTILRITEGANVLFRDQLKNIFPLPPDNTELILFNKNRKIFTEADHPVTRVIETGKPEINIEIGFIYLGKNVQWLNIDCIAVNGSSFQDNSEFIIIVRESFEDKASKKTKNIPLNLKSIYDNLPGMVYQCENKAGYKMLYVSEGALEITGYTAKELTDEFEFESIIAEGYRPFIWNSIQQNISANKPFEITYRIRRKDGSERWLWEKGKLINKHGDPYLEGYITDITAFRSAEDNLRKSENQYRLMAENTGDIIWKTGPSLLFNYVSPSITKLTGFTPEEIIGTEITSILHHESIENARSLIDKYLPRIIEGNKEIVTTELKHRCKNGNTVWAEVMITPIFNHKKEFIGLVGVTRDVTEQRSIRRVLMESEARFRNLLENIKLMTVSIATDGSIIFCNEYFTSVTGYQQNEIIGKNWFEIFVPQEDQNRIKFNFYDQLFEGKMTTNHFENQILTKNKQRRWVKWNQTVFKDNDHHSTLITSIGEDITEARQAQLKIMELNEQLEGRVRKRTAELEEANQDLEAFAYSISHDLRSPLRHIDGFVKMLSRDLQNKNNDNERYFQKIYKASERMHQMINDLLTFSRISRKELAKSRFNFKTLLKEVIEEIKPETEGRNISWEINCEGEVNGDRSLIKSALENLISNAIKFTRTKSSAQIKISTEVNDNNYQICVADNGVGFDQKYADKLFNVFQRLHTEAEFEGAGIGLANVKRIIQKHGGAIWVNATVNQGAAFTFNLPLV
ncbi:MAG TPA: PAS domain S-box protein [Bacteroidales bacterium]|nr:PAS domain S-box protein [Bacteroidales bacterium]